MTLLDISNWVELIVAIGAFEMKSPFGKRDPVTKTYSITGSAAAGDGDGVSSAKLKLIEIKKTNGIASKEKRKLIKVAPKSICKPST